MLHIGYIRLQPDFFLLEQMGVHCSSKCGGCRCGHCAPGSGNLMLLEEAQLKLHLKITLLNLRLKTYAIPHED